MFGLVSWISIWQPRYQQGWRPTTVDSTVLHNVGPIPHLTHCYLHQMTCVSGCICVICTSMVPISVVKITWGRVETMLSHTIFSTGKGGSPTSHHLADSEVGKGFFVKFEFVWWLFLNSPHGTSTSNSAVIRLYTSKNFVSSAGMLEGFSQERQELRHILLSSHRMYQA